MNLGRLADQQHDELEALNRRFGSLSPRSVSDPSSVSSSRSISPVVRRCQCELYVCVFFLNLSLFIPKTFLFLMFETGVFGRCKFLFLSTYNARRFKPNVVVIVLVPVPPIPPDPARRLRVPVPALQTQTIILSQ